MTGCYRYRTSYRLVVYLGSITSHIVSRHQSAIFSIAAWFINVQHAVSANLSVSRRQSDRRNYELRLSAPVRRTFGRSPRRCLSCPVAPPPDDADDRCNVVMTACFALQPGRVTIGTRAQPGFVSK